MRLESCLSRSSELAGHGDQRQLGIKFTSQATHSPAPCPAVCPAVIQIKEATSSLSLERIVFEAAPE